MNNLLIRRLTWAFAILAGVIVVTPGGLIGPIVQIGAGVAAILIGAVGLGNAVRITGFDPPSESTGQLTRDPIPLPWKEIDILSVVAYTVAILFGMFFVVPGGLETLATHFYLNTTLGTAAIVVGVGGVFAELFSGDR